MSISDHIKRWFGYTRRERTGTFVLASILIIIVVVRYMQSPEVDNDLDWSNIEANDTINSLSLGEDGYNLKPLIINEFDPNTATMEDLQSLGLTFRQASTIQNYRNSGGQFRKADDFRKIYGISDELKDTLIKYIKIDNRELQSTYRSVNPVIYPEAEVESELDRSRAKETSVYSPFLVELNGADSADLVRLKGIGPVLSVRIIKYRNLLGGFLTIDQLQEVYGIDTILVNSLRTNIVVDTTLINLIDINSADYSDLLRHPYISYDQTVAIMRFRAVAGNFSGPGDLVVNRIFKREEYDRIKPYIRTGK